MHIGLLGFGTVGGGVAHILHTQAAWLAQRAGQAMDLSRVFVREPAKYQASGFSADWFVNDPKLILQDPSIELVVEVVGGIEPARSWVAAALRAGKHVVTANKALLAAHGPELFQLAHTAGRVLAFEAAVAGGVPIVATLRHLLAANRVTAIAGILNGTSNYILHQLAGGSLDYFTALRQAQQLGYAESDPTLDVDGSDAAQKLALLAQMAFGVAIDWRDIPRRRIDPLGEDDFLQASRQGNRIVPLAFVRCRGDDVASLELFVSPTFVPLHSPFAQSRGAENVVLVDTLHAGRIVIQGLGAGRWPTASAVVSDMVDIANGRAMINDRLPPWWKNDVPAWRPLNAHLSVGKIAPYPFLDVELET